MHYDRFDVTAREYEAERARAIRQHQLMTAANCERLAQQVPSPLRGWWTTLCRWMTSLRTRRSQAAQQVEDPSTS